MGSKIYSPKSDKRGNLICRSMVGTVKHHEDAIQINKEKKRIRQEYKKNNMHTLKVGERGPKSDMRKSVKSMYKRKSVCG